jgi:hypothetical protein
LIAILAQTRLRVKAAGFQKTDVAIMVIREIGSRNWLPAFDFGGLFQMRSRAKIKRDKQKTLGCQAFRGLCVFALTMREAWPSCFIRLILAQRRDPVKDGAFLFLVVLIFLIYG